MTTIRDGRLCFKLPIVQLPTILRLSAMETNVAFFKMRIPAKKTQEGSSDTAATNHLTAVRQKVTVCQIRDASKCFLCRWGFELE